MIREDWVEVELNEICDIYTGTGFPKKYQGEKKGKYPFYKVGDISKNVKKGFKVLKLCDNYIEDDIVEKIKGKVLPKDSIVFAKIGEALKLNRRALTTSFCLIDNNVTGVKFKDDGMSPLFLYYIFLLVRLEDYSRATTVPSVRKTDIEKIKLPLVPVPEQRAIVAKIEELFSELDSGIDSLKKARKQLEVYRQAVLKAAFEGKLTKKWRDDNSIKCFEWKYYKIGQILETIDGDRGKNYPKKHEYLDQGYCLFLSTKNVLKGEFNFDDTVFISKEKDEVLRGGKLERKDIVITTRGTLGNVAYYDNRVPYENIRINSGMLILRIHNHDFLNPIYLMRFINSSLFIQQLRRKQSGTAQPQIPARVLKEIDIMVPNSIGEQEEIIKEIESRLSVCENIEANIDEALKKAEGLRQSILKKAFEGELLSKEELEACKQEDDWEPAEVLLKKIKEATKEAK
ncbi:MAG: restriction endonuclease subunit S [Anaerovoracaceae bacterium]|jgi:type I restriction enzyme S subunit